MNLTDFNTYSRTLRAEIVQANGQLLAKRSVQEHKIKLYSVKHFFVEIWFSKENQKQVVEVHGFKNIVYLDPYLKKITLPAF